MAIGTFYHYVSESKWSLIKRGRVLDAYEGASWKLDNSKRYKLFEKVLREGKGLLPSKCLTDTAEGPYVPVPSWAKDTYVFGFLNDPRPEEWTRNREYPREWRELFEYIGSGDRVVLLRFEIRDDEAFVVDRKWVLNGDRKEQYAFSRIPVDKYKGDYSLPEAIIRHPISFNRLEVVSTHWVQNLILEPAKDNPQLRSDNDLISFYRSSSEEEEINILRLNLKITEAFHKENDPVYKYIFYKNMLRNVLENENRRFHSRILDGKLDCKHSWSFDNFVKSDNGKILNVVHRCQDCDAKVAMGYLKPNPYANIYL